MTSQALSEGIGCNRGSVGHWLTARSLPTADSAAAISEFLMAPHLAALAIITRDCAWCTTTFTVLGKRLDQIFCSHWCGDRAAKTRDHESTVMRLLGRAKRWEQSDNKRRLAVMDFCNACTLGDAFCPNAECELASITHKPPQPR